MYSLQGTFSSNAGPGYCGRQVQMNTGYWTVHIQLQVGMIVAVTNEVTIVQPPGARLLWTTGSDGHRLLYGTYSVASWYDCGSD